MFYKNTFKNNALNISLLIGILSTATHASSHASGEAGCRTSSEMMMLKELARRHGSYQCPTNQVKILKIPELNENSSCKADLEDLQKESLQKVDELKNNKQFQSIVSELQSNRGNVKDPLNSPELSNGFQDQFSDVNLPAANLYIFVSFSMGEKALLNLAREAKQFDSTLVLRGFVGGSYLKTAQSLQKIILKTGQGVLIDPELYTLFNVTAAPTFVLAKPFQLYAQERTQTPLHDKLQGHLSVRYALEKFAERGDLQQEAQQLLNEGVTK